MISLDNQFWLQIFKKARLWLSFFVLILLFTACQKNSKTYSINGNTMGTTYSIKIVEDPSAEVNIVSLKSLVDSVLQEVNQQMSTYIPDSEISQFNKLNNNNWFQISSQFFKVIENALKISELTNGAFDITVGPLMDLWGFGGKMSESEWQPSTVQQVNIVLKNIGYSNLEIKDNKVRKTNLNLQIDVNAIAKGYGVDKVFELLQTFDYENILVEIGGEVRCAGLNENNELWKIGIDNPIQNVTPGSDLHSIISINNNALATSGDYRNYIKYEDELYSHTINPITGFPTQNKVASASVVAPNCMLADAFATAIMVMGKEGIDLVNSINTVEALIIFRTENGELKSLKSVGWR